MSNKEHVQKLHAIVCAYFVHAGHLTKEEAKELAGLDDRLFEEAYAKAGAIFAKIGNEPDKGIGKLFETLASEVTEYMKNISGYGIA